MDSLSAPMGLLAGNAPADSRLAHLQATVKVPMRFSSRHLYSSQKVKVYFSAAFLTGKVKVYLWIKK
jgi:hypothetical protein